MTKPWTLGAHIIEHEILNVATESYVDSAVEVETLWDRAGSTLTPHTANDSINLGDGSLVVGAITGASFTDGIASIASGALSGVTTIGMSGQLTNTLAIGTSPFAVTSTTVNTNLNADLWDGYQFADYLDQAVKQASSPTLADLTLSGNLVFSGVVDGYKIQILDATSGIHAEYVEGPGFNEFSLRCKGLNYLKWGDAPDSDGVMIEARCHWETGWHDDILYYDTSSDAVASPENYERARFSFDKNNNYLLFQTEKGGTGGDTDIVVNPVSNIFRPLTDNDIDLGSATYGFKDTYFSGTLIRNNTTNGYLLRGFNDVDTGLYQTFTSGPSYKDISLIIDGTTYLYVGNSPANTFIQVDEVSSDGDLTLDPAGNNVILDNAHLQIQDTYSIKHTGTSNQWLELFNNDTDTGWYWSTTFDVLEYKSNNVSILGLDGDYVYSKKPLMIGSYSTDSNIWTSTNGTGSTTMYIGNETIDTSIVSDIRVKSNILPTEYGLDDLLKLEVVDFNFTKDYTDDIETIHTGLIAQDVDKIYPYAVEILEHEKFEDFKMVDYKKLIPLLIQSIQELEARVEELENK